jgi:adenylate kinase family enzyme
MPLSSAEIAAAAQRLRGLDRILLVGCSGAGKSTLSQKIGPLLGLPVIHLDREFWRPGWVEPPREEWVLKVDELVGRERWLMDGNYSATFEPRVQRAQAVIFLDFPRLFCIRRVLGRVALNFGRARQDMTPGCPEKVDWEFLSWIWGFPVRSRPKVIEYMNQYAAGRLMLTLSTVADVNTLSAALARAQC